jgi:hypothetical protein
VVEWGEPMLAVVVRTKPERRVRTKAEYTPDPVANLNGRCSLASLQRRIGLCGDAT